MPVPAILGIPFLAGFLGSLFSKVFEWFAKIYSRKVAMRLTLFGAVTIMMTAFVVLCQGLLSGLTLILPVEYTGLLVRILPDATPTFISIIITTNIARRLYDFKVKAAQLTYMGM